jgi:hypothetical protein
VPLRGRPCNRPCGRPWVSLWAPARGASTGSPLQSSVWSAMGVIGGTRACRGDPCGRPCGRPCNRPCGRPWVPLWAPARGAPTQPQKPPALQFVRIVQIRQNKKEGALCLPDGEEIQEEIQKGCVDGEEAVVAWTAEFAADQRRPSPFSLFVVPRQEHSHCFQDKR